MCKWQSTPLRRSCSMSQLPVAAFDSIFPCAPTSRDCLPQPGITNPISIWTSSPTGSGRPGGLPTATSRTYEAMVTNQSVEALPGIAGVRWYEIRRSAAPYSLHQQGTYAPNDGVHRWMGSIAQDKKGNMALGYSVVNGNNRLSGHSLYGTSGG